MSELIPNFKQPTVDVATGGQPSLDQLARVSDYGFRSILNLRPVTENSGFDEHVEVARLGMRYHHLPVATADDLTQSAAAELGQILSDKSNLPILVHCGSGNRVGALFALRAAWIHGASTDDAIKLGQQYGLTKMEEDVRQILAR
ncbi:fused DSP-PTPase phosphatase/NAD kinase-like protein [Caballeronia sp. DA-9]|uniref:fused DSP-PTPase phosphatase/NAD kinase-like protein n=1 Tax=Caballeronia sp. DA-9 TaxID=3436237 RepID=UPI003F66ADE9